MKVSKRLPSEKLKCSVVLKPNKWSRSPTCTNPAYYKVDGVCMCNAHAGRTALNYLLENSQR